MKKTLLLLLIAVSIKSFSQNIGVSDLIKLSKLNLGQAEELLSSKDWVYLMGEEETKEKYGRATFAFEKNEITSQAKSFLDYIFSETENRVRIKIQFDTLEKYKEYNAELKKIGFDLVDSQMSKDTIIKFYQFEDYIIEFRVQSDKNTDRSNETKYRVMLAHKADYGTEFNGND